MSVCMFVSGLVLCVHMCIPLVVGLVAACTSALDCLQRYVSEMTCNSLTYPNIPAYSSHA